MLTYFIGSPLYEDPVCRQLKADTPVNSLLPRDNNKILAACGNTLFILSTTKGMNILVSQSSLALELRQCTELFLEFSSVYQHG